MTKMAAMPIYGKKKNFFSLQNYKTNDLGALFAALGTQL